MFGLGWVWGYGFWDITLRLEVVSASLSVDSRASNRFHSSTESSSLILPHRAHVSIELAPREQLLFCPELLDLVLEWWVEHECAWNLISSLGALGSFSWVVLVDSVVVISKASNDSTCFRRKARFQWMLKFGSQIGWVGDAVLCVMRSFGLSQAFQSQKFEVFFSTA